MARITESRMAMVVEAILEDRPNGEATIADLLAEIPNRVELSAEDLAPSPAQPGEPSWHEQLRNIAAHKDSPGNAIYEGRLVSTPRGLRLP